MNGTELAHLHGLSKMSISKKAKKALACGENVIEVGEDRYSFTLLGGKYMFQKVVPVKLLDVGDFESFGLKKRKEAQLKLDLVKAYRNRGAQSYETFMCNLPRKYSQLGIKRRAFFSLLKAVANTPKGKSPLPYIVDRRGKVAKEKKFSAQMQARVIDMYLEKPHRAVRRMYEYLQEMFEDVPSYETVRKFVDAYKREHTFRVAFAMSPNKAKGSFKPAGGSMSESVLGANLLWELDATPSDVICSDGKRYTLQGMIDVHSRRAVISVEATSSSYAVARLLRKGILKFGVPSEVKIDNGKEYLSEHFASVCDRLAINRVLCPPYSGEYKPHIERFFKTLSHELFEEIDGYLGHNVKDREAIQDQMSHKAKMESRNAWRKSFNDGNEFAHKFALKKENLGLEVQVPLSPQALQACIDTWIERRYETKVHGSLGCTPLEKYHGAVEHRIEDERELDILLGMEATRYIRKKGIEWQGQRYWSEVFGDIVGQKVYVLSDNNMGHVYVYSMKRAFICKALNPAMHNIDRSKFTGATKRWNKLIAKEQKLLDEKRNTAPAYMMDSLKLSKEEEETRQDVHIDPLYKTEEVKEEEIETSLGELPIFKSIFEKFCWAIAHNSVDEKIERLARKNPESWEMALEDQQHIQKVG